MPVEQIQAWGQIATALATIFVSVWIFKLKSEAEVTNRAIEEAKKIVHETQKVSLATERKVDDARETAHATAKKTHEIGLLVDGAALKVGRQLALVLGQLADISKKPQDRERADQALKDADEAERIHRMIEEENMLRLKQEEEDARRKESPFAVDAILDKEEAERVHKEVALRREQAPEPLKKEGEKSESHIEKEKED